MNTIKFLSASTDMPRSAEEKKQILPVPEPGKTEYRIYFNHRTIEEQAEEGVKETHAADFVSVIADSEPTQEEWASILSKNGYTEEQIEDILNA